MLFNIYSRHDEIKIAKMHSIIKQSFIIYTFGDNQIKYMNYKCNKNYLQQNVYDLFLLAY